MIVQAPDNKTIDFGNLPPDQVTDAMQRLYPPQPMGAFEAATDKAKNAMTFGLGSVASGLGAAAANPINAMMGNAPLDMGMAYNQGRQQYQNTLNSDTVQHPIASDIGDVAGFAGSMAQAPQGTVDALQSLPQVLQNKYITRGLLGSGFGAAGGFGSAQGDIMDQLKGAGYGALTGLAAGEAIPAALDAVRWLATPVTNAIRNKMTDPDVLAQNKIAQQFTRDNVNPADVLNNMATDNSMIADAAGKNTKAYTRTLAAQPGQGQEIIANALENRQAEQVPQTANLLRQGMGGNASSIDTIDNLMAQRQAAAQPLYEAAYSTSPVNSETLDRLMNNSDVKKGIPLGIRIMQNEADASGTPINLQDFGVSDFNAAGDPILSDLHQPRLIGAAKEGLDAQIQAEQRPDGSFTKLGKSLMGLKSSLMTEVNNPQSSAHIPGYQDALDAWAGPTDSIRAVNIGRDFITGNTELGARQMAGMSDGDKELARVGAQNALQDIVTKTPDGADVVKRIFGNSDKRAKLQALFPDQQSFNDFSDQMRGLGQQFKTNQFILGGSQTYDKAANADEEFPMTKEGIARKFLGNIAQRFSSMTPESNTIAAQMLVNTDQGANQRALMSIADRMRQNASNANISNILPQQLGGRFGQLQ